jgi:uncharacterized protein YacL
VIAVLVEAVRLLVTLCTTAIGFSVGSSWSRLFPGSAVDVDAALIWTVLLGAGFGYVAGGVIGRAFARVLDDAPGWFAAASGAQLFAGGFGVVVGVVIGVVIATPLVALLPGLMGWPLAALAVLISAAVAGRVFAARGAEFGFGGWGGRARRAAGDDGTGFLVDSSAAIDGRVLELVRAGLVVGTIVVPSFVVDELQGLADAGDEKLRRRGRRGLDVLAAVGAAPGAAVVVIDDSVPEFSEVDAKLLALAVGRDASLITTDHNLARAAALRGVTVINPHSLGESLRPALTTGDRVTVKIDKLGSEPGQGVGFLDDGTMVVVNGAADSIGEMLEVEIANMLSTNVGRMAFAHPAA